MSGLIVGDVTGVALPGDGSPARLPVFADVDTGVDDALALAYLLASPDAELVGIASTGGNVPVKQVCVNNFGLLELCHATGIPVSKGADQPLIEPLRTAEDTHGPEGLGYAELPASNGRLTDYDAAEAWVRAARERPGELIGLATGPLTNLALAMRIEPALPRLLRRLVIMGGAFDYRGNTTPVAEWNISVDPESAAEVFGVWSAAWGLPEGRSAATGEFAQLPTHLPMVLGLNVTENIALTPSILSRLAAAADSATTPMSVLDDRGTRSAATNPLIRVLEDAMRFYFEFHFDQGEGYLAHLHDPLAAAVALDPDLVRYRQATVDVELTGTLTRGMTVADWNGHWGRHPNAHIGVEVDPAAFFDRFIARVGPFAASLA
jgi:purine nucleosidase